MAICCCNGIYMKAEECSLPITDLSIQRGVGAFESIRVYAGRTFAMKQHIERLAKSAQGAGIKADEIIKKMPDIIREGLARPEMKGFDGMVKPYITGGDINDNGTFPNPRFFVIFDEDMHAPTEAEIREGIALEPNRIARPYPQIKSINYLYGFIPLSKAAKKNFESLYITPESEITEAMSSNFFLCKDGKLITAPVGRVLAGITREVIITLARESGFEVEERCPREEELALANEAFITGTIKQVLSVVRIGTQKIGSGTPGPVVQKLRHSFAQNMSRWLDD